jgi:hypothetical protein
LASSVMMVLRQFNFVIAPHESPWPTLFFFWAGVYTRGCNALRQRRPASISSFLRATRGLLVPQTTMAFNFFEPITAPNPCAAV